MPWCVIPGGADAALRRQLSAVVTARPRTPRCAPARQPVNATLTAWMITATLTSLPSPRQPFKDVAVPRPV